MAPTEALPPTSIHSSFLISNSAFQYYFRMIRCPKCGHEQGGGDECNDCGVVFARIRGIEQKRERASEETNDRFSSPMHAFLNDTNLLQIDQHARHWWELLLDFEQRNQYAVSDQLRHRGYVVEQGRTLLDVVARIFLGSHRPLHLSVFGGDDTVALTLRRPFYWLFSRMVVFDGSGAEIGVVWKRWSLLRKKYELQESGRTFATISSGFFRIWTFPIVDLSGNPVATVSKKWGGLIREYATDADKFRVEFTSPTLSIRQKAVIFAAALSIDFDYFENNRGGGN